MYFAHEIDEHSSRRIYYHERFSLHDCGLCWSCFSVQDRPSTKVHAAPGGGSSLGYLFGGN